MLLTEFNIQSFCFSLTSEATEEDVLNADTEMESVWSRASDRRITLWCNATEVSGHILLCVLVSQKSFCACNMSVGMIPVLMNGTC